MAGPLVVVSVGTDHHPFDRLVTWIDGWAADHPDVRVVVQRGSAAPTATAESETLIPHAELCRLFGQATAVVVHGGPSTLMDARDAGRRPILFPRDPSFGEHVDGHQISFAEHLAGGNLARVAFDLETLGRYLDEALTDPAAYLAPVDAAPAPGVVAFGRIVDDLLGVATPVNPSGHDPVSPRSPTSPEPQPEGHLR